MLGVQSDVTFLRHEGGSFINGDEEQYRLEISTGMRKYWYPVCDVSLKPFVSQRFKRLANDVEFYKAYSAASGFDVRSSTNKRLKGGELKTKYTVCSLKGFKALGGDDFRNRYRVSNRIEYKAQFELKRDDIGGYYVHSFEERHNHCLTYVMFKQFFRVNWKLGVGHKKFFVSCAKANIGPVRCHKAI